MISNHFGFDVIFLWYQSKNWAIHLWMSKFHGTFENNFESKIPKFQTVIWRKIKPELNHKFEKLYQNQTM